MSTSKKSVFVQFTIQYKIHYCFSFFCCKHILYINYSSTNVIGKKARKHVFDEIYLIDAFQGFRAKGTVPHCCYLDIYVVTDQLFFYKLYLKKITVLCTGQHLLGNGSHGWGYAYCGEVRLGNLFILALFS